MIDLTGHRKDYATRGLHELEAGDNPLELFENWLRDALASDLPEPYAMTLATATTSGKPSARVVLLRNFDTRGLVFFTNYQSRKGIELDANPQGALVFYWPEVERQIRIEGYVHQVSREESDEYHLKRPVNSRIGSVASPQSSVIANREHLEAMVGDLRQRFPEGPPRPQHWGGYRLEPLEFEFWQGRPSRLHDRIRFTLTDGKWIRDRLAP